MYFPDRSIVERVRKEYPIGTRVELVRMDDFQTPPIGTKGTVKGVEDTASILVSWDNGSGLNVAYGIDKCRKIDENSVFLSIINLLLCAFRVIYSVTKKAHRRKKHEREHSLGSKSINSNQTRKASLAGF